MEKPTRIFYFSNHEYCQNYCSQKIEDNFFFFTDSLILYIEMEILRNLVYYQL